MPDAPPLDRRAAPRVCPLQAWKPLWDPVPSSPGRNMLRTTPATRIHRPASSQTPTCIRSPTPTTRHARPPSSSRTHPPPFPTPATRNAIPRSSAAHTLPRFPTPATQNVHTHARGDTLATRSIPAPDSHAQANTPAGVRGRPRTLANARRTRRENESNTTPPPDPHLETRKGADTPPCNCQRDVFAFKTGTCQKSHVFDVFWNRSAASARSFRLSFTLGRCRKCIFAATKGRFLSRRKKSLKNDVLTKFPWQEVT